MTETASKANDIQYSVGVGDLLVAMKDTKDTTSTNPEYNTKIWRLSNAKKIKIKGNGKATDIYASNIKIATVTQETSQEISLDHIGFPIALLDQLYGQTANKGVTLATADAKEMPEFAFGFIAPKSDGQNDAYWFPSCTLDPALSDEYDTSEDTFKEQDPSMTINTAGLRNNHVIYTKFSSVRDGAMTIDDFVKEVIYDASQLKTAQGGGQ
ncbi:MAG: major tail protein [Liquorilactobacillus nagelii]|uniref:major tail protein n=1 Tax=Liquorilactobacillus nagelii TaxID=82688 RepID=UPI0039E8BD08